jgi:hypothetical protein
MIIIRGLFDLDEETCSFGAKPEMDPLTEDDALQEAQLLDVRLDAIHSRVGLLFDLRVALQLREANTGVLVAHGVRKLSWSAPQRASTRTAWTVVGSIPQNVNRLFNLKLGMGPSPGAEFNIVAEKAAFFVGDVPHLDQVPPAYGDDDVTISNQIPAWDSSFTPVYAVFLDRAPAS